MANKFSKFSPPVTQQSLTMLTAAEVKLLSNVAQINIAEDETLIVKYRDEFLHIQRAAEQGLTSLFMLLETPNEFAIIATAWGFTTVVEDRFDTKITFRKNLGQQQTQQKLSNILVDWATPKPPTVDVAYYRESGNLISIQDSTLFVPLLDRVKARLGITDTTYSVKKIATQVEKYPASWIVSITNGNPYVFVSTSAGFGRNYRSKQLITIPGNLLGGKTPANDARIIVTSVNSEGAILTSTISGTGGATIGYTVITDGIGIVDQED